MSSLDALRIRLRNSGGVIIFIVYVLNIVVTGCMDADEVEIDSGQVFAPFLSMLRAPQLSGPFITLALDAIHTFLSCNIIAAGTNLITDTLGDVIDAVSR